MTRLGYNGKKILDFNGKLFLLNTIVALVVYFLHLCGWLPNWWYTIMAGLGGYNGF